MHGTCVQTPLGYLHKDIISLTLLPPPVSFPILMLTTNNLSYLCVLLSPHPYVLAPPRLWPILTSITTPPIVKWYIPTHQVEMKIAPPN